MKYNELLTSILSGTADETTLQEFQQWLAALSPEDYAEIMDKYLQERLQQPIAVANSGQPHEGLQQLMDRIHQEGENNIGIAAPVNRVHFLKTAWFRYAAVILLIAGTVTFLYQIIDKPQKEITLKAPTEKPDILPGSDKAILTLADGKKIHLDSSANSLLSAQGISNTDALLRYRNPPAIATVNTLTTPRGGQYQLQLSDGTMVWLNAASSITYPTGFAGKDREVSITGEAYFEVAKHATKPFIVKTATDVIQVLGTSFNINAYSNEQAVKTSLLEGSVKIGNTVVKPQQAFSSGRVGSTDLEQDLAWKNGYFNFNKLSLENSMRQIANWYDVQIIYEQGIPKKTFYGEVGRNRPLSKMLEFLVSIGVHCKQEGRTIIILP